MGTWDNVSEEQPTRVAGNTVNNDEAEAKEKADRAIAAAQRSSREQLEREHAELAAPASDTMSKLTLDIEKLRELGKRMEASGKPFLSNDEINEIEEIQKSGRKLTPQEAKADNIVRSADGTPLTTSDGQPVQNGQAVSGIMPEEHERGRMPNLSLLAATAAVSANIFSSLGDEPGKDKDDRRQSLSRADGININELANRPLTDKVDDEAITQLKKRALDAAMNRSDHGDSSAAEKLLRAITAGASPQEIADKLQDLYAAQRFEDKTFRLRNGKVVHIESDGETTSVTVTEPTTENSQSQTYSAPAQDLFTPIAATAATMYYMQPRKGEAAPTLSNFMLPTDENQSLAEVSRLARYEAAAQGIYSDPNQSLAESMRLVRYASQASSAPSASADQTLAETARLARSGVISDGQNISNSSDLQIANKADLPAVVQAPSQSPSLPPA